MVTQGGGGGVGGSELNPPRWGVWLSGHPAGGRVLGFSSIFFGTKHRNFFGPQTQNWVPQSTPPPAPGGWGSRGGGSGQLPANSPPGPILFGRTPPPSGGSAARLGAFGRKNATCCLTHLNHLLPTLPEMTFFAGCSL